MGHDSYEIHSTDDDDDDDDDGDVNDGDADNDTTEDYSESSNHKALTSSTSSLPRSSQRSISGCTKVLQRFRYSKSFSGGSPSRQPLFPRNVNQKSKGMVYVNRKRDDSDETNDDKTVNMQRPSLRKGLIGAKSQSIVIGTKSVEDRKPFNSSPILHEGSKKSDIMITKSSQSRPAVRSVSLLSQFVYKGK